MSTNFYVVVDNAQTTVGSGGYTAGAGSFALASGYGATLASKLTAQGYSGAPSATQPVVFSTFDGSGNPLGVYAATGLSTDTLTGVTLLGGTDTTMAAGGTVAFYCTAEHIHQITKVIPPNMSAGASGNLNLAPQAIPGTPTVGDLLTDSGQNAVYTRQMGMDQRLVGCIYSQTTTGTVSGSTSPTNILGTGVGSRTIPANQVTVGKTFRLRAWGFSTSDVASNTFFVQPYLGTTFVATISGSQGITSNKFWYLDIMFTFQAIGASGSVQAGGLASVVGSASAGTIGNVAGVTVATNANLDVNLNVKWGLAGSGGTTSSCLGAILEALN